MRTVSISGAPLGIDDLLAVVNGAWVSLSEQARAAVMAARSLVDQAVADDRAVYGLTTQVGHGKDHRLSEEEIRGHQESLVVSHTGGFGPPLPTAVVRAALTVRLTGIARGGSGVAAGVADVLAGMLNAGVHPVVPETSSVGAGDLGQMAAVAQVAIGKGRAEHAGEVLPGAEALRRAGITPLVLSGRDGLALISANGVSVGHGALVVDRAARVAAAADTAAALSMEATRANPSILHSAVGAAKPIPGQVAAADHLRVLLAGSGLLEPEGPGSVQDALSFRVVPQVHGALREYVDAARRAVETELNAATDNPLVSVSDQALISNGNFHPMLMAIAFDALRIALAQVGQISERRMAHLWEAFFARLADGAPPAAAYGLQLRYPAGALYPELRQLAAPATLDTPPQDLGVEDHGTSAPLSVRTTDTALGRLEDLLAIEMLLAHDLMALSPGERGLGTGTAAALLQVEEAIAVADPTPEGVHRSARERLFRSRGRSAPDPPQRPPAGG